MNRYIFQSRPKELQQTDVRVPTLITKENSRSLEEILALDPDTTEAFKEVKRKIYPLSCSLPLLIYNIPEVVSVCTKNISFCPHSILQIFQALARDVRQELAEFFPDILNALIQLTQVNELLEEIFNCISICLKYLLKNLDLPKVVTYAFPLISHKDAGIRHLASQSFAFLMKKNLDLLKFAIKEVGENAWELAKFSISNFSVNEVLKISWTDTKAAKLLHLSLAQDKKYEEEIWQSISEAKNLEVLRDWCILCNGNLFPQRLLAEVAQDCAENGYFEVLTYLIKYHQDFFTNFEKVLQCYQAFQCLLILTDFEDLHPELEIHEKLLKKAYKNKAQRFDFCKFSREIFEIIDANLNNQPEKALGMLMHIFEFHSVLPKSLPSLNGFLSVCTDNTLVWLGLRISKIIGNSEIPQLLVCDEYILREIASVQGLPEEISGEVLWTAAENFEISLKNNEKVPENIEKLLETPEKIIHYLTHPSLRVPATCLLQHMNKFMKIAWDITESPTNLSNEREKITDLKRISHHLSENPRAASLFLMGLFWERFSTLYKHTIMSLAELGNLFPDVLWEEIANVLENTPSEPIYPDMYLKFCHIRERTPVEYVLKNIIEVIIACPKIVLSKIDHFSSIFLKFFENEYLFSCYLPLFPIKLSYSTPKPTQKMILFLKVFASIKLSSKIPYKNELRTIFTSLCSEKNEEIRVHATESLINFKEEEHKIKEFLKSLAKDESFKDTLVQPQSTASETIVALCVSRAFSKSALMIPAYRYVSNLEKGHFLLKFLPVTIKTECCEDVFNIPHQVSIGFLRNLRNILKYAVGIIEDKDEVARFLIRLYEISKEKHREIMNKSISCFNILLSKYLVPENIIENFLHVLSEVFQTFSHEIRPKFIEFLSLIVSIYPNLSESHDLAVPWILLLSNPKTDSKFIHKSLDCLSVLPISAHPSLIPALEASFSLTSKSQSLLKVLQKLPLCSEVTPLALKLIPLLLKRPEIKDLLITWLPFTVPPPFPELNALLLKTEEAILLLAQVSEDPDRQILLKLGATRKKGLNIERAYDLQLEALQEIPELLFANPKTILNALSHFLISQDLGLRTSASTAILSLVNTEGLEDLLARCIKKSNDEEQIRSVLNVWNKLNTPISATDPDRSVILNLGHLQIHRRVRAFTSLDLADSKLVKKLVVPLLLFYLLYSTSKQNYQPSFYHAIINALGKQVSRVNWRFYYKCVKGLIKSLYIDDNLVTKALASVLSNVPSLDASACEILKNKVLPTLKVRICDKKDQRRPKIRKYVVVAVFKIIDLQRKEEKQGELSRLLLTLSRQYKNKEEECRNSVIKAVTELIKAGCPQDPILREFNHALEPELFALFATKILATGLIKVTSDTLSVFHRILLEYEQYSSYYFIAKNISPELLPHLLASTKTLQYIVQGLSENTETTPDDYISLALSLLSSAEKSEKAESPAKISQKEANFCIQTGAANGTRPKHEVLHKPVSAEKVFGIRMLKIGVKKSKEIDEDVLLQCKNVAIHCLTLKKDEVVIGALEILRIVGDETHIPEIVKVSEKAGQEVIIHAMKTLASLLKTKNCAENTAAFILPQVIFSLQSSEIQSSALKLLKIFVGFKIMHEVIYDAMEEVPKIIVSNPILANSACSIYSQFLLLYPLSEKRKNFHLDFLVKNLGSFSATANEGIINAIKVVLEKFPYEALKDYCDFLLLALITAVSNEEKEDYIVKYLEIASMTLKLNPVTPIVSKIFQWINNINKELSEACTRFATICVEQSIIPANTLKNEALPQVLNAPISKHTLSFLVTWTLKHSGYLSEIEYYTQKLLETDQDLSAFLVSPLQTCSMDLLEIALKSVQKGTFLNGICELIGKADGEIASRKVSAVARKIFSKGIEDNRVIGLLKAVLNIVKNSPIDRNAMIKTLIVFNKSVNSDIKEILQEIFKELHAGISQSEFLTEYAKVKDKDIARKEGKKAKMKEMFVKNPDIAAMIKQKKSKKSRLLKKNKLLKIAPYKRIKVESFVVNS